MLRISCLVVEQTDCGWVVPASGLKAPGDLLRTGLWWFGDSCGELSKKCPSSPLQSLIRLLFTPLGVSCGGCLQILLPQQGRVNRLFVE